MKIYIAIIVTAVLSAFAASVVWFVFYRKAVKAAHKTPTFSPQIAVTQSQIEQVSASITVPSGTEPKYISYALVEKLSRVLPEFWLIRKTVDYDVTYRADLWLCRPPKEG